MQRAAVLAPVRTPGVLHEPETVAVAPAREAMFNAGWLSWLHRKLHPEALDSLPYP